MKKKGCCILLIFLLSLCNLHSQDSENDDTYIGPVNGTLVIVGGGPNDDLIIKTFIELAGGKDVPIVVIPTANRRNERYTKNPGRAGLRKLGATNVTVLHTTDRKIADTDSFVIPLMNAKAIWFEGGAQWKLADVYKNTKAEKMMWNVLERGGVIGGTSAGATIQGSFLVRGDTKTNLLMMGDHQEGFGFLKNVAIDQHLLVRNRQFDMFDVLCCRPELVGIGIDENTAIVVRGNQFEVIGESYVLVYDGTFWSGAEGNSENAHRILTELLKKSQSKYQTLTDETKHFHFLRNGDKYDLLNRRIIQ